MTNNINADDPEDFYNLSETEQGILKSWIRANLKMIKSINRHHTSYGLKHRFEGDENGFYIHNGMFKGAMIECGFDTGDRERLNWVFNISNRSVNALYDRANRG